jgi:hypothetical protein
MVNLLTTINTTKYFNLIDLFLYMGHAVVQLVEALHYKLEGHRFDFQWCHWNFSLT